MRASRLREGRNTALASSALCLQKGVILTITGLKCMKSDCFIMAISDRSHTGEDASQRRGNRDLPDSMPGRATSGAGKRGCGCPEKFFLKVIQLEFPY